MRYRMVLAMALALSLGAWACAQDEGGEAGGEEAPAPKKPKQPGKRPGAPQQKGLVEGCPVLSRLGLTEEQLGKAKEIETEFNAKVEDLRKEAGDDKAKKRELPQKIEALRGEYAAKIAALLTEEQKKRYDAGMAILADYKAKLQEAMTALAAAKKEAGKDKVKEAMTAHNQTLKDLEAERDKALDEQVKPPVVEEKPAPEKPAEEKPAEGDVM